MEIHLLYVTIIGNNACQKFPSSTVNALSSGYCISKMLVFLSNFAVDKVVKAVIYYRLHLICKLCSGFFGYTGLAIFSCMPTTLSSGVALTQVC
jgi:hypothetical protein